MGISQLPRIVAHLIAQGAPRERPAAIIERATLPQQRVLAGCLHDIAQRARHAGIAAPALLIVGETAARAASTAAWVDALGVQHA
jgi:siroheme synthase